LSMNTLNLCSTGLPRANYTMLFRGRADCLEGSSSQDEEKMTPRVTSLPSPATVRPGLQLTLCPLPLARFGCHQTQLPRQVPARLLGTLTMLSYTRAVVNCPLVLELWYMVLRTGDPRGTGPNTKDGGKRRSPSIFPAIIQPIFCNNLAISSFR
jgi:hypothetical protein